jgi:hypothetical protein
MVQNGFNVNIFRKNDAQYFGTLLKIVLMFVFLC